MSDKRHRRHVPERYKSHPGGMQEHLTLNPNGTDQLYVKVQEMSGCDWTALEIDTGQARRLRDWLNHWLEWNAAASEGESDG